MGLLKLNPVGGAVMIAASATDYNLFLVSDYDPRTGSHVTTAFKAYEPRLLIVDNPNTANSVNLALYDLDRTNSQTFTATMTGVLRFTIGPQTTKVFKDDELVGIRFYHDVDIVEVTNSGALCTCWAYISGYEIE